MEYEHQQEATRSWTTRRDEKKRRMRLVSSWMNRPLLSQEKIVESLEALIAPADRIVLEGDNQKQADFLSRSLAKVDIFFSKCRLGILLASLFSRTDVRSIPVDSFAAESTASSPTTGK